MSEDKALYQKPKSYIKTYWISWIVYLIILFLIKDFWKDRPENDFFGLISGYLFISVFSAMAINWYESSRFMHYLKENHLEKRTQLKTVFGYTGGNNGFKTLGFIFSSDDLNDLILKDLKLMQRKSLLFLLTTFFSMPVLLMLIMFKFR
jgi:hypothetical protein